MTVDLKMLRDGWRINGALDNEAIELFDYCEKLEAESEALSVGFENYTLKAETRIGELEVALASARAAAMEEAAQIADEVGHGYGMISQGARIRTLAPLPSGLKAVSELEIQQRMMRLCQNVADKDLSSQDYTLRTMMIAWLVTSGWCEPGEAQRVRDLRAAFDALLMAAEGVLACTPRDMPKAYGLLSSAIVKVRGAKP